MKMLAFLLGSQYPPEGRHIAPAKRYSKAVGFSSDNAVDTALSKCRMNDLKVIDQKRLQFAFQPRKILEEIAASILKFKE